MKQTNIGTEETKHTVACPYCGVLVSEVRLEAHKNMRCPKAPGDILGARPQRRSPRKARRHIHRPADPILHSDPTPEDRQINPGAEVRREADGSFVVVGVLRQAGHWLHSLTTECPYCHKSLEVAASGPSPFPHYAKEEACRLALLEHLRTDHVTKKRT